MALGSETSSSRKSERLHDEIDPSFGHQRIKCPCENFTALSKIVEFVDDDSPHDEDENNDDSSSMRSLLDWLDGRTDAIALLENKLLSCGKRSRCRFRYGTSFAILNAIRDACRPHLENAAGTASSSSSGRPTVTVEEGFPKRASSSRGPPQKPMTYEEAFPSLKVSKSNNNEAKPHPAASNILVPRKKQMPSNKAGTQEEPNNMIPKKKNKRRIRPAQVTEPVDRGAKNSVWNAQATTTTTTTTKPWGNLAGNTANLTSQNPLPVVKAKDETLPTVRTPVKTTFVGPVSVVTPQSTIVTAIATFPTAKSQLNPTPVKKALPHQLENLVTVYSALFRNMLVPSTPLELHLLIRLLILEGEDTRTTATTSSDGSVVSFFRPMFTDQESCQRFAVLALTKLKPILQNLPMPLLRSLLRCEPFQRQCADIAKELNVVVEEYSRHGLLVEYPTESVTGTHAILSLPFDKDRDSRHNYKTQAEVAVYKNREESRDAFLGELRIFMSVKGRVLRPQDMERAQERVRLESKEIMNGLLSVNMMWFAQFFCELLLQVGLAPVHETDQELLNIADRDKLQKLHKRFSSRSTHTSKSSKKLFMSQRSNTNSTTAPVDEARLLFPGYQEFFFLFLHQLPFNFGFHLRGRMATTILDLFSRLSSNDLEPQIMKLQLIARFLGYLVFSPNWHEAGIDSSKIQFIALTDGLEQLQSLGLSLLAQMEHAWGKGQLIATVPWVTELLRLSKWDSITQTSKRFRQLLAYLRKVQSTIGCLEESGNEGRFGPSMELVAFYLERFFDETSGLPKLTSLPFSSLGQPNEDFHDCLDKTAFGFSMILIFASSPHMEDLFSLVDQIYRGLVSKSPSKARKLRPSIVSTNIGIEPSKLFGEAETGLLPTPAKARNTNSGVSLDDLQNAQGSIETKLVEAFFHQHRDVKVICEFAVNQVLKSAPSQIQVECIDPTFEDEGITNASSAKQLANTQSLAFNKARASLERRFESAIENGLEIFGPKGLHPRISTIAITLSTTRGMLSGKPVLQTLVSNACETIQRNKKDEVHSNNTATKETKDEDCTRLCVAAIEDIVDAFDLTKSKQTSPKTEDVLGLMHQASSQIQNLSVERDGAIPSESSLRTFVASLFVLDRSSSLILNWCEALDDNEFHSVLSVLLGLILSVGAVSSYGLKRFTHTINGDMIVRLVETTIDENGNTHVFQLLQDLVDANIVDLGMLVDYLRTRKMSGPMQALLSNLLCVHKKDGILQL